MKRTIRILASCVAAALLFGACTGKKTPEPERLTAEEILSLPSGYGEADRRFNPQTLSNALWVCKRLNTPAALVKGTALSKQYYYGFDVLGCSTFIKFRIDEVNEDHNIADLKPGDIVTICTGSCLKFKDADASFDFFSENIGKEIRDNDTLHAEEAKAMKVTASKGYKGEGYFVSNAEMFELIPKKGVNYWQYFSTPEDYPLQEGDSYTLLISCTDLVYEYLGEEKIYYAEYATPLNQEMSYEKLNEKYGYRLAPKMKICEEIAALFE